MIIVYPSAHHKAIKKAHFKHQTLWYVGCGCSNHGDHAACGHNCDGCVHPKNFEVVAESEAEADQYSEVLLEDIPEGDIKVYSVKVTSVISEVPYSRTDF